MQDVFECSFWVDRDRKKITLIDGSKEKTLHGGLNGIISIQIFSKLSRCSQDQARHLIHEFRDIYGGWIGHSLMSTGWMVCN